MIDRIGPHFTPKMMFRVCVGRAKVKGMVVPVAPLVHGTEEDAYGGTELNCQA